MEVNLNFFNSSSLIKYFLIGTFIGAISCNKNIDKGDQKADFFGPPLEGTSEQVKLNSLHEVNGKWVAKISVREKNGKNSYECLPNDKQFSVYSQFISDESSISVDFNFFCYNYSAQDFVDYQISKKYYKTEECLVDAETNKCSGKLFPKSLSLDVSFGEITKIDFNYLENKILVKIFTSNLDSKSNGVTIANLIPLVVEPKPTSLSEIENSLLYQISGYIKFKINSPIMLKDKIAMVKNGKILENQIDADHSSEPVCYFRLARDANNQLSLPGGLTLNSDGIFKKNYLNRFFAELPILYFSKIENFANTELNLDCRRDTSYFPNKPATLKEVQQALGSLVIVELR